MITVKLEGAAEFEAALKSLDAKLQGKITRNALREGARPILAAAKQLAPRDTGLLRKSLKIRAMKRKKGRIGFMVQTKEGDYKGDTFYAAFNEYGTSKQPPRPFMRPAFDSKKSMAIQIITQELRNGIEAAVR